MKKYQITAAFLAGAAVLAFSGCAGKERETAAGTMAETVKESTGMAGELSIWDDMQAEETEDRFAEETGNSESSGIFEALRPVNFVFSSGAGGWSTLLNIWPDGSFEGEYFDSDMGSTGETYPNGTVYLCDFKGQFTEPEKIDDHTYAVKIASMKYKNTAGTEEIKDGVRYCYSDVYGLDGAERFLIHLPGTPLESLSEELRGWIGVYDLSESEETELSFYVLDNEKQQYGFRGWDRFQAIRETIDNVEKQAADMETEIKTDSSLTQADLNSRSQDLYELWDFALNQLWDVLKQSKDSEEMEKLTSEQRAWIKEKEAAAKDAGAPYEGGSMQSMVISQKAAELTKERVYQLLEYLE